LSAPNPDDFLDADVAEKWKADEKGAKAMGKCRRGMRWGCPIAHGALTQKFLGKIKLCRKNKYSSPADMIKSSRTMLDSLRLDKSKI
jgi:hypothetical protein